tara:strand:+ start:793 stop:1482 length:690 start_codon:yes stop_codon:yes gene_type:complete
MLLTNTLAETIFISFSYFYLIGNTIDYILLRSNIIKKPFGLKSAIISLLHSIVTSYHGIKYFYNYDLSLVHYNKDDIQVIHNIIIFSLGYFVQDFYYALKNKSFTIADYIHHSWVLAFGYIILPYPIRYKMVVFANLTEISSIFYNLGYIISIFYGKNSNLYLNNCAIFAVTFFLIRIVLFPFICIYNINDEAITSYSYFKFFIPIIILLNIWWFRQIYYKCISLILDK